MKKNLTKLLALMMALALVFSLAACGGDPAEEESTGPSNAVVGESDTDAAVPDESNTDPSNTDPSAAEDPSDTAPVSEQDSQTADEPGTKAPAGNGGGGAAANKAPSGVAEIVKAYNAGIVTMKSASMNRTLDGGRIYKDIGFSLPVVGDKIDLNLASDQNIKNSFSNNGKATQISDKKLYTLNASDVSSATCKESGNNYIFTINLKNKTLDVNSAKHGDGGYSYFIDKAEAITVVANMLDVFGIPGEAEIKGGSVVLSKGVIVATVSKSTGKISKVQYSFSESVNADAKYLIVTLDEANIKGHGTVNYSA
ncbi:MAG TPA: hypothetical protein IAD07_01250 [Candidatus Fimivicinus intestinavium]|nr:hypothetical protein [Candidatus Fimivicinus intestinavium]